MTDIVTYGRDRPLQLVMYHPGSHFRLVRRGSLTYHRLLHR